MKKIGILHNELSRTIAEMAHEDKILIGDAGMPVPKGVKMIDLAVTDGVPGFFQVLETILSELCVQKAIIDKEMDEVSPHMRKKLEEIIQADFPLEIRPHQEVKELSKNVKAIIRTGEFTPYSNIILEAGVLF